MTCMRLFLLTAALALAGSLSAQEGQLPSWEVEEIAASLDENTTKVEQILEGVRPKEWIQDGAPEAYVTQYDELKTDLNNLRLSAQALGRAPEKLSVVVDTFLWLDRMGSMLGSMIEGVRRYQSGAIADLLESSRGSNVAAEAQLKEYMRQIAVATEAEMEIAHHEAQRCRASIARRTGGR